MRLQFEKHKRTVAVAASIFCAASVAAVFVAMWLSDTSRREAYLQDLQAEARSHPVDTGLWAVLGARLVQAKEYSKAERILERAAASGADDADIWLTWSACCAAEGKRVEAGSVLKLGLRNPQAVGQINAALERCRPLGPSPTPTQLAQAICPDSVNPLLATYASGSILNGCVSWWGRSHPSRSGFSTRMEWFAQEPKNSQVDLLWADALIRNDRADEALVIARDLVAAQPNSPDAHLALADALRASGAIIKGGLQYKECLKLRPNWLPAEIGLGNTAVEKRLIQLAVQTFEQATKQHPESADAWIGLGRAYINQRLRFDAALSAFETAARIDPSRTDFFPYYSDALIANYRPDEAEAIVRRRVSAEPDDARAHYLLGLAMINNRPSEARRDMAESELRTSLSLQPHVPSVGIHLAQILLDKGSAPEAAQLLRTALLDDPYSFLAMSLMARADVALGDSKKALLDQQLAVKLSRYSNSVATLQGEEDRDPLVVKTHEQLAALYASGGEMDKAQREHQMAYLLHTHAGLARKGLAALGTETGANAGVPRSQ